MKASLALIISLVLVPALWAGDKEVYRDDAVVARVRDPFLYPFLNAHGSKNVSLTVCGTKYQHVRGLIPYYLPLKEIGSIFFVTEETNYHVTFHIVNLATGRDLSIEGNESGFGRSIGANLDPRDIDRIEIVGRDKLELFTFGGDWREVITVSLTHARIEGIRTFDYDPKTRVTGAERSK